MAQHDYNIANQTNAALRADLNNALLALVSGNSGGAAPSVTYAYQPWVDTGSGKYKVRNSSNTAWVTIGNLDQAGWGLAALSGATFIGPVSLPSGSAIAGYAPLGSPAFTGTPTAPTAPAGTNNSQLATTAFVNTAAGLSVPAGSVIAYAGSAAPAGWLKCNGAAINRSTYSTLFAVIGGIYGVGDGTSTFNLPDLRGEFVRGWDDSRGIDASRGIGTFQGNAIQSHTHSISDPGHSHSASDSGHTHGYVATNNNNQAAQGGTAARSNLGTYGGTSDIGAANISVASSFAGITANAAGGTETRPRNVALLYCIKF